MIHNSDECLRLARRALQGGMEDQLDNAALEPTEAAQLAEEEEGGEDPSADSSRPKVFGAGAVPRLGSAQRRSQLAAKVGEQRRVRLRTCLRGECGVCDETPMVRCAWASWEESLAPRAFMVELVLRSRKGTHPWDASHARRAGSGRCCRV